MLILAHRPGMWGRGALGAALLLVQPCSLSAPEFCPVPLPHLFLSSPLVRHPLSLPPHPFLSNSAFRAPRDSVSPPFHGSKHDLDSAGVTVLGEVLSQLTVLRTVSIRRANPAHDQPSASLTARLGLGLMPIAVKREMHKGRGSRENALPPTHPLHASFLSKEK
jgi:hypothetical protein